MNKDITIRIVADFFSPSGYARAAIDYVFALDDAGYNVIPTFPNSTWDGSELSNNTVKRLLALSKRASIGEEIVIEEMVPELMSKQKNIAYCVWETTITPPAWANILNNKKCVLTCSEFSKNAMINGGVRVPIYVIPHIINQQDVLAPLKFGGDNKTRILTVGDFTERKNLFNTIKGYLVATNGNKNLELVVKTCTLNPYKSGMKVKQMINLAKKEAEEFLVSQGVTQIDFADIYLIDKIFDDRYMSHLYKNCDYYISASYGEAFNLPLAEAMYHGLTTICPLEGGHRVFTDEKTSILMEGTPEAAGGVEGNGRYNNAGNWYSISYLTIASAIDYVINNNVEDITKAGQEHIRKNFSDKAIVEKYTDVLNILHNPVYVLHMPKSKPVVNKDKPFVVKCVQVLNEEKLIRANLRNCYDKVDLIIIVEGAAKGRKDQINGHSTDKTMEEIKSFLIEENKDDKVFLFTKKNGYDDYEDIKNTMAHFINNELREFKDKIVLIMDADEAITEDDFDGMLETFAKNPGCSEVVPSFIHYFDNTNTVYRPLPKSLNIKHQRIIRWPSAGGIWINHPTLSDYATGQDTACDPRWQSRRICVDYKIHHYGDCKSVDFYKNKHDFYKKEIRGYLNNDRDWIEARDFRVDRLLSYDGPQPKGFKELFSNEKPKVELPHWLTSNAYNGSVKLEPLFTGMEDDLFEYKG